MKLSVTVAPEAKGDAAVLHETAGESDRLYAVLVLRHPGWDDPAQEQEQSIADVAASAIAGLRGMEHESFAGIANGMAAVLQIANERAIALDLYASAVCIVGKAGRLHMA